MISKNRQRLKYVCADFISANIIILLFDILRFTTLPAENIGYASLSVFLTSKVLISEQILLPVMMLCVYVLSGYYNHPFQRSRIQEFFTTALSQTANTLLIYFALLTNQATSVRATNIFILLSLYLMLVIITFIGRCIVTGSTIHAFRSGRKLYNVMVAGRADDAVLASEKIKVMSRRTGLHFAGYIATSDPLSAYPEGSDVYTAEQILKQHKKLGLQEVILCGTHTNEQEILNLINELLPLELPLKILPESISTLGSNIRLQSIYEEPYIDASTANVSDVTKNLKRLFDIIISAVALIFLAIPMAVIAILVRRSSPGPTIFSQQRIGYHRRPFNIYKFRSMRTDAEASGPMLSSENDPRVTPLGVILRKYRLDELPQFWNVLKGDMSLVGPRPERTFFIEQIKQKDPAYTLVHLVRPGITSWGMVKYGYASSVDEMVRRLRYDLIYISNMSISVDIKILIYTIKTVIKGRGV
ncbi:MAG: sugar transferase [Prevotella sp.]|nr:sugar transferase [Prevotella sp.]MCM1074279.1 sugar transferase [Ruminococcus sp.]